MRKILFCLLLTLNFLYPLAIISNTLDGDFGWHLRFGQEIHNQSSFPYLDTYTYTKYGQPWTNHEWGGDWLIYQIYSNFGYFWLNVMAAFTNALAFWVIGKTFFKKPGIWFLALALLCQMAIYHILSPRLAMFSQLFAALIIFIIEKHKSSPRGLFFIPIIIWLWSALHGSWILSFIIINIYLACALAGKLLPGKFQKYFNEEKKSLLFIKQLIFIQLMGAALVIINPYGIKIWREVYEYFGQSYYKDHISEWTPSYSFPIFPKILALQTVALVLLVYGYIQKKVKLTYLIFFLAFFYAGFMYKRQTIFTALFSLPILEYTRIFMSMEMSKLKIYALASRHKRKLYLIAITISALMIIWYARTIHYTNNVWEDQFLSNNNAPPYHATKFLQNYTAGKNVKIFNEFSWGGYFNWMLPNALVYLDGRGTATWMHSEEISMLQHYIEMKDKENADTLIADTGADYIILRNPTFIISGPPGFFDHHLFGAELRSAFVNHEEDLKNRLDNSKKWKKIYSDRRANIWESVNLAP